MKLIDVLMYLDEKINKRGIAVANRPINRRWKAMAISPKGLRVTKERGINSLLKEAFYMCVTPRKILSSDKGLIVLSTNPLFKDELQKVFSIAHELGHITMNHWGNLPHYQTEKEAWEVAWELLLPVLYSTHRDRLLDTIEASLRQCPETNPIDSL